MKQRRIQGKYAPKYPTYWEHMSPVVGLVFTTTVCATLLYAKPNVADTVVHAEMAGEASTSAGQTMTSPVPSPTPEPTEKQQIMAYIVEKFGDDAADMMAIIRLCENSKFNQQATNHNRNGTVDYGVAQINSIHIPRCGEAIKTDWKANLDCAHDIYVRAGKKFTPWTCAHVVGQKNYLNQ